MRTTRCCIFLFVGFIFVIGGSFLHAQDITTGLQGHWTFDEGSGTVASDSSDQGRDAVFQSGEPTWIEGVNGTALSFDGDDNLAVLDWYGIGGNAPRTVTCWVKSTDTNSHGIVSWGNSSENARKYHVRINNSADNGVDGAIRTEIQGTFNVGTTFIRDDQWYFIASVFPEGGLFMVDVIHYINGQLDEMSGTNDNGTVLEVDTAASLEESDQEFRIGMRVQGDSDNFFIGSIDEVRIYDRALSAEEIMVIMNAEQTSSSSFPEYYLYK